MDGQKDQGAARTRKLFALGVFMVLVVFALWRIRASLEERGVDSKLRALAPQVGADLVLTDFEPAKHDRALEPAPWVEGGPVRLSDHAGKVLFLNFWASYCEPCKRELPSMARLAKELAGDRFVMVAVSYDESWDAVSKFLEQIGGVPQNIVFVRDPAAQADPLGTHYGTQKIPETYVIRDGRILFRFVNERNWIDMAMVRFFRALIDG
ncbi:MAG: hypothetical protein AMXMBFR64_29770 [Myxococcales bacterium]